MKKLTRSQQRILDSLFINEGSYIVESNSRNRQEIISKKLVRNGFDPSIFTNHIRYFTRPTLDVLIKTGFLEKRYQALFEKFGWDFTPLDGKVKSQADRLKTGGFKIREVWVLNNQNVHQNKRLYKFMTNGVWFYCDPHHFKILKDEGHPTKIENHEKNNR